MLKLSLLKSVQFLSQPALSQKTGKQGRYSSLQTEQKSQQPPILFSSRAYALGYCYSWLHLAPFACITYASRGVTLQRQIRGCSQFTEKRLLYASCFKATDII